MVQTVDFMPQKPSTYFPNFPSFNLTEQNVNGKGVLLQVTKGTKDQLEACELSLVGDQMKLLEVVEMESDNSDDGTTLFNRSRKMKPSTKKIGSELHKRIYNAK